MVLTIPVDPNTIQNINFRLAFRFLYANRLNFILLFIANPTCCFFLKLKQHVRFEHGKLISVLSKQTLSLKGNNANDSTDLCAMKRNLGICPNKKDTDWFAMTVA